SRRALLRPLCQPPFDYARCAPLRTRAVGSSFVWRFGQPADPIPIARYQRFFFRARPAFDPSFERESLVARWNSFTPGQLDRPAASRPVAANAVLMLPEPSFHVFSVAGVISSVGAAQDIDPELHRCRTSALRLRSGRTKV